MREMLDSKLARFDELEQQMSDPDVLSNSNRIAAVAREPVSYTHLTLPTIFLV